MPCWWGGKHTLAAPPSPPAALHQLPTQPHILLPTCPNHTLRPCSTRLAVCGPAARWWASPWPPSAQVGEPLSRLTPTGAHSPPCAPAAADARRALLPRCCAAVATQGGGIGERTLLRVQPCHACGVPLGACGLAPVLQPGAPTRDTTQTSPPAETTIMTALTQFTHHGRGDVLAAAGGDCRRSACTRAARLNHPACPHPTPPHPTPAPCHNAGMIFVPPGGRLLALRRRLPARAGLLLQRRRGDGLLRGLPA